MLKIKKLPQKEIENICTTAINKIWKFKTNENKDWEDRIFNSYRKLASKNEVFAKNVDEGDFFACINDMYHEEYTDQEFRNKIVEELCTFHEIEFYFTIPYVYNFPTDLKIGYCESIEFKDLPQAVQDEFIDRWKNSFEHNTGRWRNEDELIQWQKQYLCLKYKSETIIHLRNTKSRAKSMMDVSLNILRFIFERDVQWTGIVDYSPNYVVADGTEYDHNVPPNSTWSAIGRYDDYFHNEIIKSLTKIYTKPNPVDIEQRVRESIIMFGIATTTKYLQFQLVLLCSALEVLVLNERENIGEKLAERVSEILTKEKKDKVKGDLIKLYKKRSSIVHSKIKLEVNDSDIKLMKNYVKSTIKEIIMSRKQGLTNLTRKDISMG